MQYTSKVVKIGDLFLGGNNPIRIQSMTNTNTLDTVSTVNQAIRMINAGSELVRITAPGVREAENLVKIKERLYSEGFRVPLIADIHFNPKAAEIAATIVEKVRINPGNYIVTSRKDSGITNSKPALSHYSEFDYRKELEEIQSNIYPLIEICKQHGTAIRIGVNHGSLGNRIVERYGDSIEGMVVSAIEYARICKQLDFHNLVLSVKSSNTVMMLNAYRELAHRLQQEDLNYPLHLGVTEAGDGEQGRMKSIVGIGAVLVHGIGDTIRVSLTEEPEDELPVARSIVRRFTSHKQEASSSREVRNDLLHHELKPLYINDRSVNGGFPDFNDPVALILKIDNKMYNAFPDGRLIELPSELFIQISQENAKLPLTDIVSRISNNSKLCLLLKLPVNEIYIHVRLLREAGYKNPVIIEGVTKCENLQELMVESCLNAGSLLLDGIGQGLCIEVGDFTVDDVINLGFGILQATRARITQTDYIACPSCGRTHFNIQQRLQEIKKATSQLSGLKIAVMGCIVNGPGEMADADYGYVGAGKGKVTLYKGKTIIKQSIPEEDAVDELLKIIEK